MEKTFATVPLIFIFVLVFCGAVSAADTSNNSFETNASAVSDQNPLTYAETTVSSSYPYISTSNNVEIENNSYDNLGTENNGKNNLELENSSNYNLELENNSYNNIYINDEIFVKFKTENNDNTIFSVNSEISSILSGATVIKGFGLIEGLWLIKIPEGMVLEDAIARCLQDPDVLYAEPNYLCEKNDTPNDPYYSYQWGLTNINASAAWDQITGSNNVLIAVIDTGVDINHVDLSGNIWVNPGEIPNNGIDDDGNGYIDDIHGWNFVNENNNVTDDNGHGTHVTGTIAAVGNNGLGVTGLMWTVRIMPLKILDKNGSGAMDDAISAISYANQMGVDIINNSWGGNKYSQALKDAIDASSALVVCSAGNNPSSGGNNDDINPNYPSSFNSSNLISVTATDALDYLAYFSDYGIESVDVAAPGVGIYSTTPGSYGYLSGTSMASPYVSGLAGLIKSLHPELTSLQIKATIMNNVDYQDSLGGKILTGGRINAYQALNHIVTDTTLPTANASLPSASYYAPLNLTLTASKPGTIFYTTDGTTIPTQSSFIYTGPLYIDQTTTLKFRAKDTSGNLSNIYTETYLVYKLVKYSYTVEVPYNKCYTACYREEDDNGKLYNKLNDSGYSKDSNNHNWYEEQGDNWYKEWYKVWYKEWYMYQGHRTYKWVYRWEYKWTHKYGNQVDHDWTSKCSNKLSHKWTCKKLCKTETRYDYKYVLTEPLVVNKPLTKSDNS